jgi:hypothetical protein
MSQNRRVTTAVSDIGYRLPLAHVSCAALYVRSIIARGSAKSDIVTIAVGAGDRLDPAIRDADALPGVFVNRPALTAPQPFHSLTRATIIR